MLVFECVSRNKFVWQDDSAPYGKSLKQETTGGKGDYNGFGHTGQPKLTVSELNR